MKFFTVPALLAAALFSVLAAVPFLPATKTRPGFFMVQAKIAAPTGGNIKIYWDNGTSYNEGAATTLPLSRSDTPQIYNLALPADTYKALRFDPIDGEGSATLAAPLRIISERNRLVYEIPYDQMKAVHQIASADVREGKMHIKTASGANDPQFHIAFAPDLTVALSTGEKIEGLWWRTGVAFAGFALLLFLLDRLPRIRTLGLQIAEHAKAHPRRAVSALAALAVVVSAYPVVFLGKSYISPNFGTTLLYDAFPTLPGYTSSEAPDVKGSDVGATLWQHVPYSFMQRRALGHGELPLWNRYSSLGTPLLGQGQSMFGDPIHFFVIAANGAAWAWDVKYLIGKWLFAASLGLIVFSFTRHLGASLLVTLAAPFVGFYVYRVNHPAIFSFCYAPVVLYCWIRAVEATTRRGAAGWIAGVTFANLALMNSGTAKEAYMLLLQMNFAGACVLLASERSWREKLAKFAALTWAGLLLILFTAPVWATFLNTLKTAYTAYNTAAAFQVQPSVILGAFDELFYRQMSWRLYVFNPSLNFLLLLGLLYFCATLRAHFGKRLVMAIAVAACVSGAFAFGVISPLWITKIPLLSNVAHIDNCFTCGLIVFWSILAGVGFAEAEKRLRTAEGRGDLAIVAVLLGAIVAAWLGFGHASHRGVFGPNTMFSPLNMNQVIAIPEFVVAMLALLLLASVIFGLVTRHALMRGRLGSAGAILLALAAGVMLWRQAMHTSSIGFDDYTLRSAPRADLHAKSPAIEYARQHTPKEPARVFGFQGNLTPTWNATYGFEGIHGPDALINPWFRELIAASPVEKIWDWRLYVPTEKAGKVRPFMDAINVRYYFDQANTRTILSESLKLIHSADLDVYESPTVWPRAFFTDRVQVYEKPEEFVQTIMSGESKPLAAVDKADLAKDSTLRVLNTDFATRTVVAAVDYKLTENTTRFTVRTPGPGIVLLSEAWLPDDFRVTVNGERKPVVRANHAFKGVVIDAAGEYRITFAYYPKNFFRHGMISLAAAGLFLGSLALALRPQRLPAAAPRNPLPAAL